MYQTVDWLIPHIEDEQPETKVYSRNNIFDDDIFDDRYIFGFDIIPYVKKWLASIFTWGYIAITLFLIINIISNLIRNNSL